MNSGIGPHSSMNQQQQYMTTSVNNNHFNNRHSSQSSQQHNRKNQFKELFGGPATSHGPPQAHHARNSGGQQISASAGTQMGQMANGSMLVTTQPGGGPMIGHGQVNFGGSGNPGQGYANSKNNYNRKFK